jgi:hypothetical protein
MSSGNGCNRHLGNSDGNDEELRNDDGKVKVIMAKEIYICAM